MGFFGGLIAGGITGGAEAAGQIAQAGIDKQNKMDLLKVQNDLDIQRAEAASRIAIAQDLTLNSGPNLAARANAAGTVKTAEGNAQTDVEARRVGVLTPLLADQTKVLEKARGDAQRANEAAYAGDPAARAGVRAKTADSHFYGPADQLAAYNLQRLKQIDNYKQVLASTEDPTERAKIQNQLADLEGKSETPIELRKILDSNEQASAKATAVLANPMLQPDDPAKVEAKESLRALGMQRAAVMAKLGYTDGKPSLGSFMGSGSGEAGAGRGSAQAKGIVASYAGVQASAGGKYTYNGKEYPSLAAAMDARAGASGGAPAGTAPAQAPAAAESTEGVPIAMRPMFNRLVEAEKRGTINSDEAKQLAQFRQQAAQWRRDFNE